MVLYGNLNWTSERGTVGLQSVGYRPGTRRKNDLRGGKDGTGGEVLGQLSGGPEVATAKKKK